MGKRLFDFLTSGIALLLLSPCLVIVALAVRIFLGSPVVFRQTRPGRFEIPFTIYKFRTMRDATDSHGQPLPDDQRLHWFGNMLRRSSLDELPELWNVLRGDMSLVGPRPLLMKYLPFYTAPERVRFSLRPGITGWAQIHGRNEAGWDHRLGNDIWYVQNQSFWLDIKILWLTVTKVLRSEKVVVDPRSIMLNLDEERSLRKASGD